MIHALFSDLHADKQGLETLQDHPAFKSADRRICLGDVINAHQSDGARAYFEQVQAACDEVILGNHEAVLIGEAEPSDFHSKWKTELLESRHYFENHDQDFLAMLKTLPRRADIAGAQATHASFGYDRWRHVRYIEDVIAEADHLPARINFLAHGHIPFIAWQSEDLWYYQRQLYGSPFVLTPETTYLINTGSILGSREMRQYEKTFLTYDDTVQEIQFYTLGES